jgi:hypothetical protein
MINEATICGHTSMTTPDIIGAVVDVETEVVAFAIVVDDVASLIVVVVDVVGATVGHESIA